MAIDNTNFPLSSFPTAIGTYTRMSDISADTLSLINQYNVFLVNNDYTSAINLYNTNELVLKPLVINAWVINKLQDELRATQTYVSTTFDQHIREIIVDRGIYSPTEKYVKFNMVSFLVNGAYQTYECLNDATPIGTAPTNTSFWVVRTLRGEQGASGTGLAPRGAWVNTTTYYVNDFVVHNNVWWACKVQNSNSTPSNTNSNWLNIFDFTLYVQVYDNSNSTLTSNNIPDAIDELDSKINSKNAQIKYGTATLGTTWSGTSAPYTQVVATPSNIAIISNSNIIYDVDNTLINDSQLNQFLDSKVVVATKATNSITFKAFGTPNTISIPLSITNLG